jgi:hypothetical protein
MTFPSRACFAAFIHSLGRVPLSYFNKALSKLPLWAGVNCPGA